MGCDPQSTHLNYEHTVPGVTKCFIRPAGDTDFTQRSALLPTGTMALYIANKSLVKSLLHRDKTEDTSEPGEGWFCDCLWREDLLETKGMSATFPAEAVGD